MLRKNVLLKFSKDFDLRDTVFKLIRSMRGVEVVIILTQSKQNQTRVNFRSAGRVNVAKLAHSFKGGGHHNASGCVIDKNIEKAKKEVLTKLKRTI